MASKRKTNKMRWMSVKKMIKDINSYGHKFDYRFGNGYYIFEFDSDEYNLHFTFDKLPDMLFGVWRTKKYGNDVYYFFAEHKGWIDKFKPSAVAFTWSELDEMMTFVHDCIKSEEYYISSIKKSYNLGEDWEDTVKDYLSWDNGFYGNERNESVKKFNQLVSSLDVEKFDIFWCKSGFYHRVYDVFYLVDESVTDDEVEALDKAIEDCNCVAPNIYGLTPHYWKNRKKYFSKVHPSMKHVYENEKLYKRVFKVLSKQ